jgi:hypothetical protein
MIAAMKKGRSGIDELLKGMEVQAPEKPLPLQQTGSSPIEIVLGKYTECFDYWRKTEVGFDSDDYVQQMDLMILGEDYEEEIEIENLLPIVDDVLAPAAIQALLELTVPYKERSEYASFTGAFISRLMRNSVAAGHRDFYIDVDEVGALENIGRYIEGDQQKKVTIKINGNVGSYSGSEMEHVNFLVDGEVGTYCGDQAEYCSFKISSDALKGFGRRISYSDVKVGGKIYDGFASAASECTFDLSRIAPGKQDVIWNYSEVPGSSATGCAFRTPYRSTAETLLRYVPFGNTVIWVTRKGREVVLQDMASKKLPSMMKKGLR